ncbi:hypothetical protein OE749_13600 [Aestuariibacter sp. AA17]|uniref:Ig-like domain-containing protein n=1 Tax=Fluctibacter corallii TaxID=2984329 RepID=A0ABT3AAM9_9ALTE|nr:hypothetical protein [Aestuariibacter sp. AA17]MCV2885728.1 hypothetical protein [Aestuariibacter sp. AA17]
MKISSGKALLLSLSVFGLTACGGGSSDSDASSPSTSPTSSQQPTPAGSLKVVNPIPDLTAKVGVDFNFEIPTNTCESTSGQAVSYGITRLTNASGLTLVNFEALVGKPTKPNTVLVTVTCRTASSSVKDEFKIVITEDNVAPTVDAGSDQSVKAGEKITLSALAADINTQDEVVSYEWVQVGENMDAIDIIDGNSSSASFIAPDVEIEETFTFSVTVKDKSGAEATDTVDVKVVSRFVPDVNVHFPLQSSYTNADKLDVFGAVDVKNGASLSKVVLDANGTVFEATVDAANGTWRATDVDTLNVDTMTVKATDSKGLSSSVELTLSSDQDAVTVIPNDIVDIGLDSKNDTLYVQTTGLLVRDNQTHALDLQKGTASVLNIQPAGSDFDTSKVYSFTFDENSNQMLLGFSNGTGGALMSVEPSNLQLKLITSSDVGHPVDIVVGNNGTVYLVDNNNESVSSVDLNTGNRTLVAGPDSTPLAVDAPIAAAFNPNDNSIILAANSAIDYPFLRVDTGSVNSVSIVNGASNISISDLEVNEKTNTLYYINADSSLVAFDLTTEKESVLIENLINSNDFFSPSTGAGLAMDTDTGLLFVVGKSRTTFNNIVVVVDTVSGDYIQL